MKTFCLFFGQLLSISQEVCNPSLCYKRFPTPFWVTCSLQFCWNLYKAWDLLWLDVTWGYKVIYLDYFFLSFPCLYFHSYRQKSVTYCSHLLKGNRQRPVPFDSGLVMSNFTLFIVLKKSLLVSYWSYILVPWIHVIQKWKKSYRREWEIWWRKDCVVFPPGFLANKGKGADSWETILFDFFVVISFLSFY